MLPIDELPVPIFLAGYNPNWVYCEPKIIARVIVPPPKVKQKGRYHNRIKVGDIFGEVRLGMTDRWVVLEYSCNQGRWLCKNCLGGTHYYSSAELHEMNEKEISNAK